MLRGDILIRPEIRTAGGEVCDILYRGKYVGHITLVYREKEVLSGSVQLDKRQLESTIQDVVMDAVNEYVQSLIQALGAKECDVRVTHSTFAYVIASDQNVGTIREFVNAQDPAYDLANDETEMHDMKAESYELVIVEEEDDLLQYHVYRETNQSLVAEAFIVFNGSAVSGEMIWKEEPEEDELDAVTELLISDFDEEQIDEITIDMRYNGELIETIELMHSDVIDDYDDEQNDDDIENIYDGEYTALLVRDEGDVLIYDLFEQRKGGLPIAQATIDISRLKISGIIEFEQEMDEETREIVAETLMDELDKEIQFETFHVTMLHNQVPIDNILFENETIHG